MKKIIVFAAALLVSFSAFAQETNRDAQGNIQKGPYETNAFWDNWSLGAGVGIDIALDNVISGLLKKDQAVGRGLAFPAIDVTATKWFEPCFGARFGWQGLAGKIYDTDFSYNYAHGDLLWNWSNQFWGYKEKRFYNLIPYLHAGWTWTRFDNGFAAGAGIINKFRMGSVIDLLVDLRLTGVGAAIYPDPAAGHSFMFSAIAGLNFNLGKSNWTRKATTVAGYAAAVAAAEAAANAAQAAKDKANAAKKSLADKNAALAAENQQLKDELAKAGKDNGDIFNNLLNEPIIAYFEIGKAKLTAKEQAHVEYAVKNIISQGKNVKFTLSGNADSKTGSKKRNQQLSEQRADYIYKLLTEKYGLDASQFTVKANGGNDIFDTPELNRACIIEKQ